MGCGPQPKVPSLQRADTLIGILRVSVIEVLFPKQAELKNPFLKVRVSNQQFSTKNLPLIQKDNKVNEAFTYAINSFYKAEGRTIEVGVFQGENFLAYGAIDANPIISKNSIDHEFRCILASDKQKKFGHAKLNASFQQLPSTQITFRFQSATIRRKGSDNKVSVKLVIGEQILQTSYQEDTLQKPPIWKDQMLNYKIPSGITKGSLKLIDGSGKQIGGRILDLSKMVQSPAGSEVSVAEQLSWTNEDKKEIDAANLKYSYIIGEKASFQLVNDILRSSVRGIRSKNQIDQPNLITRQK